MSPKVESTVASVIRLFFKTSSVIPDFFYIFNLTLLFSTFSQSFFFLKKSVRIRTWEVLGANVLKTRGLFVCSPLTVMVT